ncbi:serine/threonine-protein phosphatase BSL1 [Lathyrus oleraceus]|nr:serine/threonine-protein phosphatase BSL1-like [Pisum sativum]
MDDKMDVKTAFLNENLLENVYMTQPEGFDIPKKAQKPKHFLFSHSQPHLHENILASILNIVPPPSFTTHHLQLSPLTAQFSIHAPLSVSAASTPQLIFQRFVARRSFPPTHSPLIPFRYVFNHRSPPRFLYTVEYEDCRIVLLQDCYTLQLGNVGVVSDYDLTKAENNQFLNYNGDTPSLDDGPETPSFGGPGLDKYSLEKLKEASAAEAEAASAVWQSVQAISSSPADETSVSDDNSHAADTVADGSDTEGDVHLHPRVVVVAKEAIGNLGGMVRQLSLDQFENESRRMLPINSDSPYPTKKFTRQKSPQGLHKKIISNLLRPRNWKAPANRRFFLDSYEVGELCYAAEQIFMHEPTVLQLKAPVKVFGDLHGQFGDLMRLFDEYGFPSTAGDITYIKKFYVRYT